MPLRPVQLVWLSISIATVFSVYSDVVRAQSYFGPAYETPRMTLLQWSHGGGFRGGAPGPDEPLVADRPDFTEASVTVGRGVVQLEMGYTFTNDEAGGDNVKSHSYPEPLLRVGLLAEWLEFRMGWNYAEQFTRQGGVVASAAGAEDMYLGFKIALTPQEGILPETAIIPQMTVPSGGSAFRAEDVLPGLNWVYSWELNDCLSLAGSTQGNGAIDDSTSRRYLEATQSIVLGQSLTERIGAYAEWYGCFPYSADNAKPAHTFNGGFTFLVNNNLQFDVRGGVGLNQAAEDYFVGAGSAIRF